MKKINFILMIVMMLFTMISVPGNCTDISGLQIGEYIQLGKYYDKPILWRCADIDENGILILSDKALCRKPFDGEASRGLPPEFTNSHRRHYSGYTNYWGDSNIRSWLNSSAMAGKVTWLCGQPPVHNYDYIYYNAYADEKGFLADGNFTQTERNVMKEVTQKSLLDNYDAELAKGGTGWDWGVMTRNTEVDLKDFIENKYDNLSYEYVTDKVFLLDIRQLWNISQKDTLGEDYYYSVKLTQEGIENDEENRFLLEQGKPPTIHERGWTDYWLRTPFGGIYRTSLQDNTPSGNGVFTSRVISKGYFSLADIRNVTTNQGIRPAFYLNEENAQILSGSGTAEDPYVMDGKQDESESGITVFCNGSEISFDQSPFLESDRVMVPMRMIFEALGADVQWNEEEQSVTATCGTDVIKMQIGNTEIWKNDVAIESDVAPRLIGDRTFVPLRVVSESLGASVEWIEEEKKVVITK